MIAENKMFDKLLEERGYIKEQVNPSLVIYKILNEVNYVKYFIRITTFPYPCDPDYDFGARIVEAGENIIEAGAIKYLFRKKYSCSMEEVYEDILKELEILESDKNE